MRILYLHQYFLTPEQGGAIRSYHLAKALVEEGHEVTIISAHNHLNYHFENIEGIKVHYLPIYYENNMSNFGRIISFTKYMFKAYQKATEIKDVDICYASSTPLTIGIIALWLKRLHRIKFYFEVRDLWPEAPIQMGVIKNYFVKHFLFRLEKRIYRNAEKIIALSPGIEEGIKQKVANKQIIMLPNFSDCEFFYPEIKDKEIEKKYAVEGKFVISYFGAIGKANHLDYLLECAEHLLKNNYSTIQFIIAGKGGELHQLKEKTKKLALTNINFIGFSNKKSIHELLSISDAVYISFANKPILETNSPNKFFDGLASGKVCITNTKGWTKELIEENHCGFYYNPENPSEFIQKIIPYLNNPILLKEEQTNSRRLAETKFSKDLICKDFVAMFKKGNKKSLTVKKQ